VGGNGDTTDAFALAAPLIAGGYTYELFRGGVDPAETAKANNWYLRSRFTGNITSGSLEATPVPALSTPLAAVLALLLAGMTAAFRSGGRKRG
jgi:outer membrane autotransporter protein